MDINEFSELSDYTKYDTLWLEGQFLTNMKDENYEYQLYSIDGFFVEMRSNINDLRGFLDIKPF